MSKFFVDLGEQRVDLLADRHGGDSRCWEAEGAGCFPSSLWVKKEEEVEERRRRRRREGNTLHDNTYICLPFCSLSYQGLSLWQSAVVVTGG